MKTGLCFKSELSSLFPSFLIGTVLVPFFGFGLLIIWLSYSRWKRRSYKLYPSEIIVIDEPERGVIPFENVLYFQQYQSLNDKIFDTVSFRIETRIQVTIIRGIHPRVPLASSIELFQERLSI